jgi:hypothetical protein
MPLDLSLNIPRPGRSDIRSPRSREESRQIAANPHRIAESARDANGEQNKNQGSDQGHPDGGLEGKRNSHNGRGSRAALALTVPSNTDWTPLSVSVIAGKAGGGQLQQHGDGTT